MTPYEEIHALSWPAYINLLLAGIWIGIFLAQTIEFIARRK